MSYALRKGELRNGKTTNILDGKNSGCAGNIAETPGQGTRKNRGRSRGLRKAVKQGHSLKDIQAALAEQGISVSLSRMETVLGKPGKDSARKKTDVRRSSPKDRKTEPGPGEDARKNEPVKPETRESIPAKKEPAKLPSYYTPDLPDSEL